MHQGWALHTKIPHLLMVENRGQCPPYFGMGRLQQAGNQLGQIRELIVRSSIVILATAHVFSAILDGCGFDAL
jgi:hypothetical protein